MSNPVNISFSEAAGAYALFSLLLFLWLGWKKQPPKKILIYFSLFTWFCLFQAWFLWIAQLRPFPPDSLMYFGKAETIAESSFQISTIANNFKSGLSNFGLNVYVLAESIVIYLTYPSYALVHIANIFLGTMAIFYASKFVKRLYGLVVEKYVIFLFLIYFGWYWTVLQNIREAPLILFAGIALFNFLVWWEERKPKSLIFSILASVASISLRPENSIILLVIVALVVVFRSRSRAALFWKSVAFIPLIAFSVWNLVVRLRGQYIIQSINYARMNRVDAGYFLTIEPIGSLKELILQLPQTVRFFLVPIPFWNIDSGFVYVRLFAHSLATFIIISLSVIGIISIFKNSYIRKRSKRLLLVLSAGTLAGISVYSIIDIVGGAAARHSALFFYLIITLFASVGILRAKEYLGILVKRRRIQILG